MPSRIITAHDWKSLALVWILHYLSNLYNLIKYCGPQSAYFLWMIVFDFIPFKFYFIGY